MTGTLEIKTEEQKRAGARSKFYNALSKLFTFPDENYINEINSGTIRDGLLTLADELPYSLSPSGFLDETFTVENIEDFQSSYIKTFDVSPGGPPCPLYEGLYYPDRRKIMEDLMRFYEHFGLKPDTKINELPDHISMELEFMHFLSFKETQAMSINKDPRPLRLAQKDFLERHLSKWLPVLNRKLVSLSAPEFYRKLFLFLEEFIKVDCEYIAGMI